jgi:hypothetical protein
VHFATLSRLSLKAADDAWEIAFIGNNLTNKLTLSNVNKSNYAGGSVLPGLIFGRRWPARFGRDGRLPRSGRELWVRLTLRPLLFNRGN